MKRGGYLSPTSRKRVKELRARPAVRQRVFERDGRCRAQGLGGFGPCFGHLTVHHIVKEGQGGSYTEANLIALCAHHNDLIEADADVAGAAADLGWVRRSWETS